jgi:hypothetical protein
MGMVATFLGKRILSTSDPNACGTPSLPAMFNANTMTESVNSFVREAPFGASSRGNRAIVVVCGKVGTWSEAVGRPIGPKDGL